jgi:circadian clock protein KaiB
MVASPRKPGRKVQVAAAHPAPNPPPEWDLCLYVLGESPRSVAAIANLRQLCEENLSGKYRIEVIDLRETPQLSRDDQIVAIPTLVRKLPMPVTRLIGDLSDTERTLVGLQLKLAKPRTTKQKA